MHGAKSRGIVAATMLAKHILNRAKPNTRFSTTMATDRSSSTSAPPMRVDAAAQDVVEQSACDAGHALFATPELLEMILLNLPIPDLPIKTQRVSKHWNASIYASTAVGGGEASDL